MPLGVAVAVVLAVGLALSGACGGRHGSAVAASSSIAVGVLLQGGGASRLGRFDTPLTESA
ncbi:hypothetical protein SALBM311S_09517 [Streptomyces alboniger]